MPESTVLEMAIDLLTVVCLIIGSGFCVISGIGIVRMPDFYTRGHAAGLSDTLGAGLILLGLILQAGFTLVAAKLVMIFFFLYITGPTATHALFKAAYADGMRWDVERQKHHPGIAIGESEDPYEDARGDRGSD
ncbi:MAG: monovalent cation/H(+) antiporter subunit G [Myxococcota bacterium]|jgi:multicomponent Na+:H+ antiporter subunit G|nr:monovalent cation/H(+) antiporter subunit G [Myxococcota bacterium]